MNREMIADEIGMTREDLRWLRWENERDDLRHRWRALRAIWCKPVLADDWYDKTIKRDARGDDWTLGRAVKATIGILLNRRWTDKVKRKAEEKRKKSLRKSWGFYGYGMAFWDNHRTYGGYAVMVVWLYPGCRVSIFSDGECNL